MGALSPQSVAVISLADIRSGGPNAVRDRLLDALVKLTGGQRIDLLGIRKDDLPKVWHDLDMPSGFAYGKSYRTRELRGLRLLPVRFGR